MSPSPLGLRIPIFQAPTGSVAGPELAAAVAEAGGMGGLGLTWTEPDVASQMVRQVLATTTGSFQANFALAFPPKALAAALEAGVPFVTFSWGDPSPYLAMAREAGAGVGIQVANLEGAKRALGLGADFLVCQGIEAGGHVQSTTTLEELLPQIVTQAGPVPVIAAGGIATGKDIAHVLRLGAAGAMLGTRFVATRESRAHSEYKRALVEGSRTALTVCYDGGWPGAPHRVLRNSTLEAWEASGCPASGARPGEGDEVARMPQGEAITRYEDTAPRAGMEGRIEEMCLYAGAGVAEIRDIPTAGELVERLWRECQAAP